MTENGPMLSVEDIPVICDVCDEPQHDGESGEDWDGETGTHFSCQGDSNG